MGRRSLLQVVTTWRISGSIEEVDEVGEDMMGRGLFLATRYIVRDERKEGDGGFSEEGDEDITGGWQRMLASVVCKGFEARDATER